MSEKSKHRILFLSRDPENEFSLKSILTEAAGEIEVADTRIRAQQLMSIKRYDLVIAGLTLSKISGIDFCRQARGKKEGQSVPIVIVGEDDDKATSCISAFNAGADDFIQYPFLPDVLVARCQRFLSKSTSGGATAYLSVQASAGELPGILQYLEADMKTGKLKIQHDDDEDRVAEICLEEGRLMNVTAPYCEELEAVAEVLSWSSTHVTFDETAIDESEKKYDLELTGTIMNFIVDVDEFNEIKKQLPTNEMMYGPTAKTPGDDMPIEQKQIYELAITGYFTEDLVKLQRVTERKATIWLNELIEEGYLDVADSAFENYTWQTYEAYKGSNGFARRFDAVKKILSGLALPLPELPSNLPFGAVDWFTPAPKIVVTGDNIEHIEILIQSFVEIATAASQRKPLVRKHRKGAVTTRLFFDEREVVDIQQLPPAFDKLMMNSLPDHLSELYGIIFLISSQDKKASQENLRRVRILRQRFRGINFFIVPKVPNQNGVSEFRINCSSCGYRLSVDMNMAGSMGECPICKDSITIPDTLDHLAHTMHLTDDVPIALIKPQIVEHCRDLLLLTTDSILTACHPPEPIQQPTAPAAVAPAAAAAPAAAEPEFQEEALRTQVRERAKKPTLKIKAADESQEVDVTDTATESTAEEAESQKVLLDYGEDGSSEILDEILNADEDQFDIDDFIKSVRGD